MTVGFPEKIISIDVGAVFVYISTILRITKETG